MKNLDKMSVDAITVDLISGEISVNELNPQKLAHRDAFADAAVKRPALLEGIHPANAPVFIKAAIEKTPKLFVCLKPEQYTDELAQIYLGRRFKEYAADVRSTEESSFVTQRSMDDKIVLNYSYATQEGDELYYFDPEFRVPLSIKSSFKISLKLVSAVALIKKLDIHITQLGIHAIHSTLSDLIINGYKEFLNSYITKNKVGYYTLSTSYEALKRGYAEKMNALLADYGLCVSDCVISGLAIPKDIQNKIEDQAFEIRQRMADVEAEAEMAKLSLASYEAKLAIQQKYPDADHTTLTEFEKDLALKRYLIKNDLLEKEEVDRSIDIEKEELHPDRTINKPPLGDPPALPQPPKKSPLGWVALVCGIVTFLAFVAGGSEVGLPALLVSVFVLCIIALAGRANTTKAPAAPAAPSVPAAPAASDTTTTSADSESTAVSKSLHHDDE